jgi:hypothetical protein
MHEAQGGRAELGLVQRVESEDTIHQRSRSTLAGRSFCYKRANTGITTHECGVQI